jgi:uridine kinase
VPGLFIPYSDLALGCAARRAGAATLLIGIDGPGASGKSTLARRLATHLVPPAAVVHVDDFHHPTRKRFHGPVDQRPVAADYDRERLASEVLVPLRARQTARYRRYDWDGDALAPAETLVAGPLVVIEGVYATSAPLRGFYDVTLWVDCPRELRLERGLARDGPAARERWLDWMAGEDLYVARENPRQHATFVCDGSRGLDDEGVWLLNGTP